MLGREPLMGETLCDAEREAVLGTGGYKRQACVTDGGQHNNIGTAGTRGAQGPECTRLDKRPFGGCIRAYALSAYLHTRTDLSEPPTQQTTIDWRGTR